MKKICIILCLLVLLSGCAHTTVTGTVTAPPTLTQADPSDMFTERDESGSYEETAVKITMNGSEAACASKAVSIGENTILIAGEGTYCLTGSWNGSVIVNADKGAKVQLVLENASITSADFAAIYVAQADKVFVTLAENSENALESQGEFVQMDDNNVDAAIFSKADLTLNGSGKLTVISQAGHGIVTKDDLVITGGSYTVSAASHALNGKDSIRISDGTFALDAGKDGLHAENDEDASLGFLYIQKGSFDITAQGDGISAGAYLQIDGGDFEILAGGGYENGKEHSSGGWGGFPGGGGGPGGGRPRATATDDSSSSMKGLKSGTELILSGGSFIIDSADDSLHANTSLSITGGTFAIASGDDAVHAEENLTISDCEMNISTCYEGLEALHIYVSGGSITLKATDDGLNAAGGTDGSGTGNRDDMFGMRPGFGSGNSNGSIHVSGGTLYINSSGDGMDANGTLEISGGHVTIVGPTSGDTATLDYDVSGIITGGTFIGTGSTMMAQTFSDSAQGVIAIQASTQAAGTTITLTDKDGNVLISYAPELSFQVIILSTPDMVKGEEYTLNIGSLSKTFEAS